MFVGTPLVEPGLVLTRIPDVCSAGIVSARCQPGIGSSRRLVFGKSLRVVPMRSPPIEGFEAHANAVSELRDKLLGG
jgi:hypothetical protein